MPEDTQPQLKYHVHDVHPPGHRDTDARTVAYKLLSACEVTADTCCYARRNSLIAVAWEEERRRIAGKEGA